MSNPAATTTARASGSLRSGLAGRPGARLSLRVLLVLAVIALCAELIASPLPWIGRIDGQLHLLPDVFTPAALVGESRADLDARAATSPGDFAFGPLVHFGPYDPDLGADGAPRVREAPSRRHLFGTDSHGRDVLARVLYGTRVELSAAVVAVSAQLLLGALLGALAGFVGGIFDVVVTRTIEALTAVPLILLLVVVQALVSHPTLSTLLMAYAATRWTEVARLVRVEVMRVSQSDYVLAARALGATPLRVLVHHIAPNARAPLLVAASLGVADLVLAEASLDFLGVGAPPILATWGEILSEARHHAEAWWLLLYPGLALFLTLLLLYRLGDAFRDVLDPARRSYLGEARPGRAPEGRGVVAGSSQSGAGGDRYCRNRPSAYLPPDGAGRAGTTTMSNFGRSRGGGPPQPQRMPPAALIGGGTMIGGSPGPGGATNARGASGSASTGPSAVVQVTEREFEREVMQSELPVMLEFAAEQSPQSKQVAPVVEELAREMAGKLKVVRIDVERSPLLARELRIQAIPTFMVFAEGRIADGVAGVLDKKKMLAMVEPFLPRAAGALKTAELAQLLPSGQVTPVDTRDAAAFARAHLPRAVHMPLEEVPTRVAELYMLPGQPVLYCRSGDKSKELAATLGEQGVEVAFLEGGLLGWESDGLPIERGERGQRGAS